MEESIIRLEKLASVAMAGVVTVSLAACGGSNIAETIAAAVITAAEAETTAAAEGAEAETTEAPATGGIAEGDLKIGFVYTGDENEDYTVAHYNGAMETKEALELSDNQIIVKWNIPEDETAKDAVIDLADQGCQTVLVNSFGHESYVIGAAKEYPDVQLCHVTGFQAASSGLSNMHNYFTSICEARYVSGVVAGLKLNQMMEDGIVKQDICKIGYVGAYPCAEVISGYTSFFLGARSICPDVAMEVKYTNSWANFDLEKEAADALISDGCVLISQHADTTGVPTACEATGVPCVGYSISITVTVPNQAPTFASNNWNVCVTEVVQHVIDGTGIPVDWYRGSSDDAVLTTELSETAVTPGTKEKMDEVEAKLTSGELHVFDTSTWTVGGETLGTYRKDGSDIEYVSGGYSHKSESGSASSFDILIDGITTIDN